MIFFLPPLSHCPFAQDLVNLLLDPGQHVGVMEKVPEQK